MRKFLGLACLTMAMGWAGSAHAQSITFVPNITNNSAMDYRNVNAPIGTTMATPNTTGTAFPYTLTSMFYSPTRTNTISNTIPLGHSTFPTPAQMQASAPSYFKPFQMYRASFIAP